MNSVIDSLAFPLMQYYKISAEDLLTCIHFEFQSVTDRDFDGNNMFKEHLHKPWFPYYELELATICKKSYMQVLSTREICKLPEDYSYVYIARIEGETVYVIYTCYDIEQFIKR